jgi:hypothetical protein
VCFFLKFDVTYSLGAHDQETKWRKEDWKSDEISWISSQFPDYYCSR